ncbi:MAG: SMI1/KNR4 family protein [Opitutaceae bacterium]
MGDGIKRLLSGAGSRIASPLSKVVPPKSGELLTGRIGRELLDLLAVRNGFYAFESALLVRPLSFSGEPLGVIEWNDPELWRREYTNDLTGLIFFAEDVFGAQFCFSDDAVSTFDPETGEHQVIAGSLDAWATWVLEKHRSRTGWPLAQEWKTRFGILEPGQRLLPKIPFVLGGAFEIKNLYKLHDAESLRMRASIANQLRDCPDGSKVVLKTDWPT